MHGAWSRGSTDWSDPTARSNPNMRIPMAVRSRAAVTATACSTVARFAPPGIASPPGAARNASTSATASAGSSASGTPAAPAAQSDGGSCRDSISTGKNSDACELNHRRVRSGTRALAPTAGRSATTGDERVSGIQGMPLRMMRSVTMPPSTYTLNTTSASLTARCTTRGNGGGATGAKPSSASTRRMPARGGASAGADRSFGPRVPSSGVGSGVAAGDAPVTKHMWCAADLPQATSLFTSTSHRAVRIAVSRSCSSAGVTATSVHGSAMDSSVASGGAAVSARWRAAWVAQRRVVSATAVGGSKTKRLPGASRSHATTASIVRRARRRSASVWKSAAAASSGAGGNSADACVSGVASIFGDVPRAGASVIAADASNALAPVALTSLARSNGRAAAMSSLSLCRMTSSDAHDAGYGAAPGARSSGASMSSTLRGTHSSRGAVDDDEAAAATQWAWKPLKKVRNFFSDPSSPTRNTAPAVEGGDGSSAMVVSGVRQ
mmetsp:Transcript_25835/g.79731  ORF Transcript_25835/g.79731 Transcript_25835/m.79731 type:complete len:495 (-) Transcript_25835:16-1500(-)